MADFPVNHSSRQDGEKGKNNGVDEQSLQEMLASAIGAYVICEFLIGTQNIVTREGVLASVGGSYFLLYQEQNDTYLLCDLFTLKFITFFQLGNRPRP